MNIRSAQYLELKILLLVFISNSLVEGLCPKHYHPHQMAFLRQPSSMRMTTTQQSIIESTPCSTSTKNNNMVNSSSSRYQDVPIVLVGFSGAGDELMRLADTLVDQYYTNNHINKNENNIDNTAQNSSDEMTVIKGEEEGIISSGSSSSIVEVIGCDPEGIFTLRANDLQQLIEEGSITPQDVIVIDFANRLISEKDGVNAPQLQARLLEALEYLYMDKKCLVLYVNVDAETSLMAPIPTLMKDQIEHKILDLSTYEICIKDEGLHPNTIRAIQELGIVTDHGDDDPNTNTTTADISTDINDSSSSLTPEEDEVAATSTTTATSAINEEDVQAIVARQRDAWEGVQFELLRIVAHANLPPTAVGSEEVSKLMGPHTFFLSLSFDDVTKVQPYVAELCKDVDAMELRVDLLSNNHNRHHVLHQMQLLRRLCRPYAIRAPVVPSCSRHTVSPMEDSIPIVYTVRTEHQAGTYDDDAEGIHRMFQLLQLGLRGATEVLDVESAWDKEQTAELLDQAEKNYPSTIILGSHHVVGREIPMAEAVDLFLNCGLDGRAHAAKVVLSINDESKVYMAYDASVISSKAIEAMGGRKVIPNISLILGTVGEQSRVINPRFTPVTHECLPFKAAPGQLSASELMKRRIEGGFIKPRKYAILGHNIAYSVSPQMHGAAFAATSLPHTYGRADVASVEEFIRSDLFNSQDFGGCSVTIPHKVDIIPYVDVLSDAAAAIGSVNTLVIREKEFDSNEQRKIYGDNTDWIGIFNPLKRRLDAAVVGSSSSSPHQHDDRTGVALILGGGGTARASAYAAKQLGLNILYYNRTPSKAIELANTFGGDVITSLLAEDSEGLGGALSRDGRILRVVISTLPKTADFELPEWVLQLPVKPIVLDVNYKPYHTPLLNQSEKFGCEVVRGSEMLWEQGVQQFELWTGRKAPYKVMKDIVLQNCLPEVEQS